MEEFMTPARLGRNPFDGSVCVSGSDGFGVGGIQKTSLVVASQSTTDSSSLFDRKLPPISGNRYAMKPASIHRRPGFGIFRDGDVGDSTPWTADLEGPRRQLMLPNPFANRYIQLANLAAGT
jgi:hypothetical protein